jgi:hypothetical protein
MSQSSHSLPLLATAQPDQATTQFSEPTEPTWLEPSRPEPSTGIAFFGVGLVTGTVLVLILKAPSWWKLSRDRKVSLKRTHRTPCNGCQHFDNNPYLKCAVHPSTVLTPEAQNCSDYQPNQASTQD